MHRLKSRVEGGRRRWIDIGATVDGAGTRPDPIADAPWRRRIDNFDYMNTIGLVMPVMTMVMECVTWDSRNQDYAGGNTD
jgi:hypothetical protein